MVKRSTSLMLFFCCLLIVLGCSRVQESKIIGKWSCNATGDRMELFEDHTCILYSMGHYTGRWAVSKSGIKVEAGQIVLIGSLDGEHMTVEDNNMHNKYTFEKVVDAKS